MLCESALTSINQAYVFYGTFAEMPWQNENMMLILFTNEIKLLLHFNTVGVFGVTQLPVFL